MSAVVATAETLTFSDDSVRSSKQFGWIPGFGGSNNNGNDQEEEPDLPGSITILINSTWGETRFANHSYCSIVQERDKGVVWSVACRLDATLSLSLSTRQLRP